MPAIKLTPATYIFTRFPDIPNSNFGPDKDHQDFRCLPQFTGTNARILPALGQVHLLSLPF
jgi:hypothetical protein